MHQLRQMMVVATVVGGMQCIWLHAAMYPCCGPGAVGLQRLGHPEEIIERAWKYDVFY